METMVLEPTRGLDLQSPDLQDVDLQEVDLQSQDLPSFDLISLEFEMTGPAADSFTMDFSLCTSTTTTCSTTGPRPK